MYISYVTLTYRHAGVGSIHDTMIYTYVDVRHKTPPTRMTDSTESAPPPKIHQIQKLKFLGANSNGVRHPNFRPADNLSPSLSGPTYLFRPNFPLFAEHKSAEHAAKHREDTHFWKIGGSTHRCNFLATHRCDFLASEKIMRSRTANFLKSGLLREWLVTSFRHRLSRKPRSRFWENFGGERLSRHQYVPATHAGDQTSNMWSSRGTVTKRCGAYWWRLYTGYWYMRVTTYARYECHEWGQWHGACHKVVTHMYQYPGFGPFRDTL